MVFQHLQTARLGQLDLELFKRQVNYCRLPNGTVTDNVLQSRGRYDEKTNYDWMGSLGIWFENLALPVVINECVMQSYNGIIRLFPNWKNNTNAEFKTFRAVGAFLVSAKIEKGKIGKIEIFSENGGKLKIYNPWKTGASITIGKEIKKIKNDILEIETQKGETIFIKE